MNSNTLTTEKRELSMEARQILITGSVQGMGFRPHVFRLAQKHKLNGWVKNTRQGVEVRIEGNPESIRRFVQAVPQVDSPGGRFIMEEVQEFSPQGLKEFCILESSEEGERMTTLLPDLATCSQCIEEIGDSAQRRFRYPFTNCTQCGPRFTIAESLPYDRNRTTMKKFSMCFNCRDEYENPRDRRFHAQPIACPDCGPQLSLWDAQGNTISEREGALEKSTELLKAGFIVAVKSVGGFHLMLDATDERAVQNLRQRKRRPSKPFALMFPNREAIREVVEVTNREFELLQSPAAPIVLLEKKKQMMGQSLAPSIAPKNPWLGVMLPSNPLQHLLMEGMGLPLVATSGNVSDEPICHDEGEALERLDGIADYFLVHDRPIAQTADDSIVRVLCSQEQVLRRARGYAPLPIPMKFSEPSILALGGHLKSTIALSGFERISMSQHLGNLENARAFSVYEKTLNSFKELQSVDQGIIAHDPHPDYAMESILEKAQEKRVPVQHHVAHVFSCITDNQITLPVLGIAWDGAGYGLDGSLWGGEVFVVTPETVQRLATFRQFPLPGGGQAMRQPEKSVLGLLYSGYENECFGFEELEKLFSEQDLAVIRRMLEEKINCPSTSSCGRLFDAVSALSGFSGPVEFEGQAAMDLEFSAREHSTDQTYPWLINEVKSRLKNVNRYQFDPSFIIDWKPMLEEIREDVRSNRMRSLIAKKFHNSLADLVGRLAGIAGITRVALTGGCFQNRLLTETTIEKLRQKGFHPYWHRQVPPNDGGLSLGQVGAALWQVSGDKN